jgi:hypothetical protein
MSKQTINIGQTPNDKTGDPLRTAFNKINNNFDDLYNLVGDSVEGLTEKTQDFVAQMLINGQHDGVIVAYDDNNNRLNITIDAGFDGGAASTIFEDDIIIDGGGA